MFIRTLLFFFSIAQIATPAFAQNEAPPRPKVIATPEPKPQPKKNRAAPDAENSRAVARRVHAEGEIRARRALGRRRHGADDGILAGKFERELHA